MMNKSTLYLVLGALTFGLLVNSFFIVSEKERAIVFQFGEAEDLISQLDFILNYLLFRMLKSMTLVFKHLMKNQIGFLPLKVNIY